MRFGRIRVLITAVALAAILVLPVALAEQAATTPPPSTAPAAAPATAPAPSSAAATAPAAPPAAGALAIPVLTRKAPPDGGKPDAAELEMGKQAAAQIEKETKVLDDPKAVERIAKIIARIAPTTERPAVEYQAKLIADPGINAFSLPGGFIYVTKGLMEAVESEDELAAVIGHEMAHVCLKHGIELAKREAKMNNKMAIAVLAAVLAGNQVDPGSMIMLGSLVKAGLLSGYSQKDETEADENSVVYLQRAGYHPVAMLTVIQGLARMELTRPELDLGIFRTHPFPAQRASIVRQELDQLGLDANPRVVLNTLKTKGEAAQVNGRAIGRVSLDDYVIFEPAVDSGDLSPQQRAEKIAADLDRILQANLAMYDVRAVAAKVMARSETLITVLPGDAEFQKTTPDELARKAAEQIKLALWQETVRREY